MADLKFATWVASRPDLPGARQSGDYVVTIRNGAAFKYDLSELGGGEVAWSDVTGKPDLFDGAYGSLSGLPTLFSGAYADLSGKPASFPPAPFDASLIASGVIDTDRLPPYMGEGGAANRVTSSGDLSALTTEQQAEIVDGTIVTTTDGVRYIYSGSGSKTLEASYIKLADITPEWSAISGKPTFFSGAYADLTGKPALFSGAYGDLTGRPTLGTAAAAAAADFAAAADAVPSRTGITTGYVLTRTVGGMAWQAVAGGGGTTLPAFTGKAGYTVYVNPGATDIEYLKEYENINVPNGMFSQGALGWSGTWTSPATQTASTASPGGALAKSPFMGVIPTATNGDYFADYIPVTPGEMYTYEIDHTTTSTTGTIKQIVKQYYENLTEEAPSTTVGVDQRDASIWKTSAHSFTVQPGISWIRLGLRIESTPNGPIRVTRARLKLVEVPATGTTGHVLTKTATGQSWQAPAAGAATADDRTSKATGYWKSDDFDNFYTGVAHVNGDYIPYGGYRVGMTGTAAAVTFDPRANGTARGAVLLTPGTTSTGMARIKDVTEHNPSLFFTNGKECVFRANIGGDVVSDATNRFALFAGFTTSEAQEQAGAYNSIAFEYVDNVNSGKWLARIKRQGGSETIVDTGVAYNAAPVILEIRVDKRSSGGTGARFYINNNLVATIVGSDTNLQSILAENSIGFTSMVRMDKRAGTAARYAIIDYLETFIPMSR